MGVKAHLRTMAAVLANATATTLVYPSVQGPAQARRPREPPGRRRRAGLRAGARRGRPAARIAAAVYVSPELYSLPVSQQFASLRPPLGGRTRLVMNNQINIIAPCRPNFRFCKESWPNDICRFRTMTSALTTSFKLVSL